MPLPTVEEIDTSSAKALEDVRRSLQMAFAEGVGTLADFRNTMQAFRKLHEVWDTEAAVEASIALRDRPEQPVDTESYSCISHADRNDGECEAQYIAIFIDGSSTSFHALQYTIGSLCHKKKDHIYIVTVIPNGTHHNEAEHTLQQAYNYAHHAGKIEAVRLHMAILTAENRHSSTGGIGEAMEKFVSDSHISLVVLGSRGMGSIKRSLLSTLGMGSVSEFAVRTLSCPVVVVKEGYIK